MPSIEIEGIIIICANIVQTNWYLIPKPIQTSILPIAIELCKLLNRHWSWKFYLLSIKIYKKKSMCKLCANKKPHSDGVGLSLIFQAPETVYFSRNLLDDLTRISKIDEDLLEDFK